MTATVMFVASAVSAGLVLRSIGQLIDRRRGDRAASEALTSAGLSLLARR